MKFSTLARINLLSLFFFNLFLLLNWGTTALALPLTNSNVLVTSPRFNTITEYNKTGSVIQSHTVPYPGNIRGANNVRDSVVMPNGKVAIYNGTFDPYFTQWSPHSDTYTHRTFSGWSTINGSGLGGIAVIGNLVFTTDMRTFGDGGPDLASGIIRFNLTTNSAARFAEPASFIDLTIGFDGLLYGLTLGNSDVLVYDPNTLALLRSFTLQPPVSGIAVNSSGLVFGSSYDGNIYKFANNGSIVSSLPTGHFGLLDIDLNGIGEIVVSGPSSQSVIDGKIIFTDQNFSSLSSFDVYFSIDPYVSFTTSIPASNTPVPEPNTLMLLASGLIGLTFWSVRKNIIRPLTPNFGAKN
ncbi:PEP-CTERM sorting domain-containing protein [Nitrospira sp. M1]